MSWWQTFHNWASWKRWAVKAAAFLAVSVLVLYPKFWLLPRWVGRLRDMNAMVQPDHPGLKTLVEAVHAEPDTAGAGASPLALVEKVVCRRVPYAWDWDTWGVVDYLPTTSEVLEKGREDCDGRAVLAAALLRRLGYQAWLVSDLKHVWVRTPQGELMSPGEGERTLQATSQGTRITVSSRAAGNLARGLAFGIAVFPLTRELIMLAALCAVTLQPRSSHRRRVAGCLLLLLALALLRDAGATAHGLAAHPSWTWAGLASGVVGWLLLAIKAGGHRSPAARPR